MIGVLRPQSPPNKKNEGAWLARGTLLDNASRRYLAERHDGSGVRHPSLSGGPQRDVSPVASSPTLLDGECKTRGVRRLVARQTGWLYVNNKDRDQPHTHYV